MNRVPNTARHAAVAAAFVLAGCAKSDTQPAADTSAKAAAATPPAAAATPNMVSFTAKEYSFEGPDTIPAGLTMIHLTDAGQQLHHVQLLKLEEGKTFADFQAAAKNLASGPPPAWVVPYGGVNPPAPGATTTAMEVLEAGNYAVVCFVEDANHVPHMAKGMMKGLTVTPSPNANLTEPTADVTLTLSDYAFTLSKPLVAGRQLIKVENAAAQPHEVVLVQLAPGKTIEDLGKWVMDMKGPPPGKPFGGIPGFMKGKNTFFEVNLEPGEYGMICFVPDAKDGKPHFTHGMTSQFKVS
jgi:hypothetical protein